MGEFKEIELEDDEVIREGDFIHYSDRSPRKAKKAIGKTVRDWREYQQVSDLAVLTKVTRPQEKGEKPMKKESVLTTQLDDDMKLLNEEVFDESGNLNLQDVRVQQAIFELIKKPLLGVLITEKAEKKDQ